MVDIRRIVRILIGLAFTGLVIWTICLAPFSMIREERARAFGEQQVSAVLMEKRVETAAGAPRHLVVYRYHDLDGFARLGMAELPEEYWHVLRPGDRLDAWFASGTPGLSRVRHQVESEFRLWLRARLGTEKE